MLLFGQISLVSPIANAIAIPLVSFFVAPLALVGSVAPAPLGAWVLEAAHFLVEQLRGLGRIPEGEADGVVLRDGRAV